MCKKTRLNLWKSFINEHVQKHNLVKMTHIIFPKSIPKVAGQSSFRRVGRVAAQFGLPNFIDVGVGRVDGDYQSCSGAARITLDGSESEGALASDLPEHNENPVCVGEEISWNEMG